MNHTANTPNILEVNHLSKRLGTFALDDVSFALPQGFIMGFIGENGAGKTTTIKLMLNMLAKDKGEIKIFGQEHLQYEREIKERIGVVMDSPYYVDAWTMLDIEHAVSSFYSKWDHSRYMNLLEHFSLEPKKQLKALSRGMKMKLMVAVALTHDPDLLILDEPTSGLDAVARNELMEILRIFMTDERKGVLFSTHITSDLEKVADYITLIHKGRILETQTKDELLEKYLVVKGGLNLLTTEQRQMLIGYREHSVGFDGLIDCASLRHLPTSIVTEPSNFDEIMIRFNMGGEIDE
ncbi:MAG: ABC transporter ATP-binding protein [Clostridiales Family XIII bacterium]|jgi:ABC-2 type transport system ATP-binding protein|nr:ABC transporter ATP-binding protein [Clostridiales Family XIII bacterium]